MPSSLEQTVLVVTEFYASGLEKGFPVRLKTHEEIKDSHNSVGNTGLGYECHIQGIGSQRVLSDG